MVVERGRVIGVWEQRRRKEALEVSVAPFAPLGKGTRAAVVREARSLADRLGAELELSGL